MADVVRAALESDGLRVWQLLRQFATSYPPDESAFAANFPVLIRQDDAVFLVAESDGFVHGYLLAFILPTLFANGPILSIVELVVDEARRGGGMGTMLVQAALTRGWERGCVEAVVPTRRAAAFYEKLGFVRSAEYLKLARGNLFSHSKRLECD